MSESDKNKDNDQKTSWLKKNYPLERWVLIIIVAVLLTGFIFPLYAEAYLGAYFPDKVKGVEIWNQFTSVVLGIIATVLSLVSIFMGFKSYDDSSELQKTCIQTLERLSMVARDVKYLRDHEPKIDTDYQKPPLHWEKENINAKEE